MIDRRHFVVQSLGLMAGGAAQLSRRPRPVEVHVDNGCWPPKEFIALERLLEITEYRKAVGEPRTRHLVREGFHPIAPQRVAILRPHSSGWAEQRADASHRSFLIQEVLAARSHWPEMRQAKRNRTSKQGRGPGLNYPPAKLDAIVSIIRTLTDAYGLPGCFRPWARNLAVREDLMNTAYYQLGIVHDFQSRSVDTWKTPAVPTVNGTVDWWLFLFPAGIVWRGFCDEPTYAALCPVVTEPDRIDDYIRTMTYLGGLGLHLDQNNLVVPMRRMDQVTAARFANLEIARALARQKEHPNR